MLQALARGAVFIIIVAVGWWVITHGPLVGRLVVSAVGGITGFVTTVFDGLSTLAV